MRRRTCLLRASRKRNEAGAALDVSDFQPRTLETSRKRTAEHGDDRLMDAPDPSDFQVVRNPERKNQEEEDLHKEGRRSAFGSSRSEMAAVAAQDLHSKSIPPDVRSGHQTMRERAFRLSTQSPHRETKREDWLQLPAEPRR